MEKSIIIDVGVVYTRAVIFENNKLVNILLENHKEAQIQGAIYQGRIVNKVKSIKAVFVDIGKARTAFLHYKDMPDNMKGKLQNNQRIMVQVIKEGFGNKGPKATGFINITGKFMVLLPFEDTIGISKKIVNKKDRERLKTLMIKHNKKRYGVIIRTCATEATGQQLRLELKELTEKWENIKKKAKGAASGTALYKEPCLSMKVVREFADEEIKEIVINDKEKGKDIQDFLSRNLKGLESKVRIVSNLDNLFGAYNIDREIEKSLKSKIWLKSGANIIIEKTEAMNVIDVNSAKFSKTKQRNKMVLKANLDAAKESARQIRLRNLSGIIIIDFIDMSSEKDQNQVIETLELELNKDKIKTQIYPMTQLGLVQITRQRKRLPLQEQVMQSCNLCHSPCVYMTYDYLSVAIEKEIRNIVRESIHRKLVVVAEPGFIQHIKRSMDMLSMLESKYGIKLQLVSDDKKDKAEYMIDIKQNS